MRLLVIVFFVLLSDLTYGAGGASTNEIPWDVIRAQVFNVVLAIGFLIYFTKDKVKEVTSARVVKFDEEYKKAQDAKENAKAERDGIKKRLDALKENAEKSIQESYEQAKENTKKLLAETQVASNRIIKDAEGKVQTQLGKVVNDLKLNLLKQSFAKAKGDIPDNISQPDLQRLKEEFIKNIQVVKQWKTLH